MLSLVERQCVRPWQCGGQVAGRQKAGRPWVWVCRARPNAEGAAAHLWLSLVIFTYTPCTSDCARGGGIATAAGELVRAAAAYEARCCEAAVLRRRAWQTAGGEERGARPAQLGLPLTLLRG